MEGGGEMNHRELDRRLCERLGIEPAWHVDNNDEYGETIMPVYPALSTTGEGMVRLLDELRYQNYEVVIEYLLEGLCYVRVGPANWKGCLPAPPSLALTAAAALGIEVSDLFE